MGGKGVTRKEGVGERERACERGRETALARVCEPCVRAVCASMCVSVCLTRPGPAVLQPEASIADGERWARPNPKPIALSSVGRKEQFLVSQKNLQ
jgi:hypothetical protein